MILLVAAAITKADQIQGNRSHHFEPAIVSYPVGEFLRQRYVLPHVKLESFDPIVTNDKPQL